MVLADSNPFFRFPRYTCLVCSYRPVFDTVDMLTVHRKGKKHLEGETFTATVSDYVVVVFSRLNSE